MVVVAVVVGLLPFYDNFTNILLLFDYYFISILLPFYFHFITISVSFYHFRGLGERVGGFRALRVEVGV